MLKIGCIADDFTGAGDAASFLSKAGMRSLLFSGVPDRAFADADAAVIALKTRGAPVDEAVAESRRALEWLRGAGAERYYVKYCSTFDSTPEGNIGPICDMAMEWTRSRYTVLCPSLPVNGRTVRNGELYVHGVPLNESPMKDHPLTPMWDSRLCELMRGQSRYPVFVLSALETASAGQAILRLRERCASPFYVVPDYETDEQGERIASVFGDLRLWTGGSGLLEKLGARLADTRGGTALAGVKTPAVVLAGSCSPATRGQIACWRRSGRARVHVDVGELLRDEAAELARLTAFLQAHAGEDVLIDSSEDAALVRERQTAARDASERIERAMRALALRAYDGGCRRLIVAGGETSGAVTSALRYRAYRIGQSVAPGVPVMSPLEDAGMRLVLKSGNFGREDFFLRALSETGGTNDDAR